MSRETTCNAPTERPANGSPSVGVRELKARLSGYIARVKAGESIVVTEHGHAVARLVPPETGAVPPDLDGIHLASAGRLAAGQPGNVTFGCWDLRLWRAARDEGLAMLPATEPA